MEYLYSIIPGTFILLVLIWGILLLCGKASVLIPSYNLHVKNPDAKFFERIFCRYVGLFLIILILPFSGLFVGLILEIKWLSFVAGGISSFYLIGGIFYLNISRIPRQSKLLAQALEEDPSFLNKNPDLDISVYEKFRRHYDKTK